jgi:hypothetical protein
MIRYPLKQSVDSSGTTVLFPTVGATALWSCCAIYTPFTRPFKITGVQRKRIHIEEDIQATLVLI